MANYVIDLTSMGKRIREIRLSQVKTQEYFDDQIHIYTSYLTIIEKGKRTAGIDILAQIAMLCNVTVDYLLFGETSASPSPLALQFESLCNLYSSQEIEKALKLAAFYLALQSQ